MIRLNIFSKINQTLNQWLSRFIHYPCTVNWKECERFFECYILNCIDSKVSVFFLRLFACYKNITAGWGLKFLKTATKLTIMIKCNTACCIIKQQIDFQHEEWKLVIVWSDRDLIILFLWYYFQERSLSQLHNH